MAKRRDHRRKEVELRFDNYVELFTNQYLKRRWKDWKRIHAMLVHYAVPALGSRKLSDIRRADLGEMYRRLDNKPSVARAMHATLRKMFRWAMGRDDIKFSPVDGGEAPPPLRARSRYLSDDELRAAWATSFTLTAPYGAMLRMLMLTGQRRGEVTGLDWSEVSRSRAEWVLPAARAKNGHSHIVPLSVQAVALLDGVAGGKRWPSCGLIFRSTRETALSGFSKIKQVWDEDCSVHERQCERAGRGALEIA